VASKVYFVRTNGSREPEELARKSRTLFENARLDQVADEGDLVGVKLHFGEGGNREPTPVPVVREIVASLLARGAKPFLTETSTLYRGSRQNAVDHTRTILDHGYTLEATGAPILMLDGLLGESQVDVPIDGKHYKTVKVATGARALHALVGIAHITGHGGAAFAGQIKNVGMGMSSRGGKLMQHSGVEPRVDPTKCTACGACVEWCPTGAAQFAEGGKATILRAKCIGCGQCYSVCPAAAIPFNWGESSPAMQEKMAEHVLGVVKGKEGKTAFLNFAVRVTRDCDCGGKARPEKAAIPDVGVLASTDPVALDRATYDLIAQQTGRDVFRDFYPNVDGTIQMRHAAAIGAGSIDYELEEVQV